MTESARVASLEEALQATGPTAVANREGIGRGWNLAVEMLNLHSVAIEAVSRAAGGQPKSNEKVVILLGVHGANLTVAALGLIVRGQFDVVRYLMRSIFDCHTLMAGCGLDPNLADRFLRGEEKLAAVARKQTLAGMRADGDSEDANWIESRFKGDYEAANDLSHVAPSQVGLVLEGGSVRTPVVGGRVDPSEASLLWKATLEQEHWALIWLSGLAANVVDDNWRAQFGDLQARVPTYMKDNSAAQGRGGDAR